LSRPNAITSDHGIKYVYTDGLGCSDTATATFVVVTTAIDNLEEGDAVSIYPNPATDKIQIACPKLTGNFTSTIYNAQGALDKRVEAQKSVTSIDVSDLPFGLYTIQIVSHNFAATKKILIR
jgi:hypothetical protein